MSISASNRSFASAIRASGSSSSPAIVRNARPIGRLAADHRSHDLEREDLPPVAEHLRRHAEEQRLGVEHQAVEVEDHGSDRCGKARGHRSQRAPPESLSRAARRARTLSGKSDSWSSVPSSSNGIGRKSVSKAELGIRPRPRRPAAA